MTQYSRGLGYSKVLLGTWRIRIITAIMGKNKSTDLSAKRTEMSELFEKDSKAPAMRTS